MHKFDVKSMAKLDSPERRSVLPPDKIIEILGLNPGDTVADMGCGIGYFTFPVSLAVGSTGKVYAMENDLFWPDEAVDVGLVIFVLHEARDTRKFLSEVKRILRTGGILALIDWEKRETPQGPPVKQRIDKECVA